MKILKRIMAVALVMVLSLSLTACSSTGLKDDGTQTAIVEAINDAGEYLVKKVKSPDVGDETVLIALNRSTYIDFWHNRSTLYDDAAAHKIRSSGYKLWEKDPKYAGYYDDIIICHTTLGTLADLSYVGDLMEGISYDDVVLLGGKLNKVQALIALESGKYNMAPGGDLTREDLIDFTMSLRQKDGSFGYDNMGEITPVKATATAVTALALTGEADKNPEMAQAIEKGVNYVITNIKETDSLDDIVSSIIALNTTGHTSTNVHGKDLTQWLLAHRKKDGAFSENDRDKKGNVEDTATALMGLASQYRFNAGMTSIYDLSDVKGGTHNKLSPDWEINVKFMISFMGCMIAFLIYMIFLGAYREFKWKREGIWDYENKCRMDDADVERIRAERAAAKKGAARKPEEKEEK